MKNLIYLIAVTPHNIDRNNRWFAFAIAAGLGILGSVISLMISTAFAIVFLLQLAGKIRKSEHPDFWKIAILFLVFFTVSSTLSIVHFDGGKNLNVIIERLPFLAFFPLVMALSYSSRHEVRDYLEYGAALGSILTLVFVIYELGLGAGRAEGADGNPGPFALSVSLAYTLCLFGLLRSKQKFRSALMLVGAAAAFICVLASGIRAMWPALLILFLIAGWSSGFSELRKQSKIYLAGLVLASAITYMVVGDVIAFRVNLVMQDIEQVLIQGQYDNSLGERLVMWKFAWTRLSDAIWIGLGEAGAVKGMDIYALKELGYSSGWSHFHNFVINAIMQGGILELTAIFALLFGPLIIAWKHRKDEISRYGFAFMVAIVVIFIESGILGITFGHDIMDHLYTYMMAAAAWLVIGESKTRSSAAISGCADRL